MRVLIIYTILASIIFISCSKDEENSSIQENYYINLNLALKTDWEMANQINVLINNHRDSLGLPSIIIDNQHVSAYAVDHTEYMIGNDKISHDNFTQRSSALKARGAISVAENVAFGYSTAEDVVNAWLHSPTHKNIIEGSFTHTGFGILKSEENRYFFTQIFYK